MEDRLITHVLLNGVLVVDVVVVGAALLWL